MNNVNKNTATPAMMVAFIKQRAGCIPHRRLLAARVLLGRPVAFEEHTDPDLPAPTLAGIEESAEHRSDLVPDHPETRVAIGHTLEAYGRYSPTAAPALAAASVQTVGESATGDIVHPLAQELEHHGSTPVLSARDVDQWLQQGFAVQLESFVNEYGFVDWLQAKARSQRQVLYIADAGYRTARAQLTLRPERGGLENPQPSGRFCRRISGQPSERQRGETSA